MGDGFKVEWRELGPDECMSWLGVRGAGRTDAGLLETDVWRCGCYQVCAGKVVHNCCCQQQGCCMNHGDGYCQEHGLIDASDEAKKAAERVAYDYLVECEVQQHGWEDVGDGYHYDRADGLAYVTAEGRWQLRATTDVDWADCERHDAPDLLTALRAARAACDEAKLRGIEKQPVLTIKTSPFVPPGTIYAVDEGAIKAAIVNVNVDPDPLKTALLAIDGVVDVSDPMRDGDYRPQTRYVMLRHGVSLGSMAWFGVHRQVSDVCMRDGRAISYVEGPAPDPRDEPLRFPWPGDEVCDDA